MSSEPNTILLERAAACIEYFESKMPAQLIEEDLSHKDMESLQRHVAQAEAEMSAQHFSVLDVLQDDLTTADELANMRSSDDY